jgi:prepilin-type processing-associated H-X9-DG protein
MWWAHYPGGLNAAGFPYPQYAPGYPTTFIPLPQIAPTQNNCDPTRVQGFSLGGIQVLFMDGHAQSISPAVSQLTWAYLIQPDDGQIPGNDY